jgi:cytochrome c
MNATFIFGGISVSGFFLLAVLTFNNVSISAPDSGLENGQVKNNPPKVKITRPANNSIHLLNSVIPYSISVSDPEDGDSKYDEIPSNDVLVQLMFVEGAVKDCDCYEEVIPDEPVGLSLIKNSDCFTCHQFKSTLIGPSFQQIAARYSSKPSSHKLLATRIREGSQGTWGEVIMPGHPDISQDAATRMVDWILQKGSNEEFNYLVGMAGSVKLEAPAASRKGYFILHAMYTDRGLPDKPTEALTGSDIIVLRYQ